MRMEYNVTHSRI